MLVRDLFCGEISNNVVSLVRDHWRECNLNFSFSSLDDDNIVANWRSFATRIIAHRIEYFEVKYQTVCLFVLFLLCPFRIALMLVKQAKSFIRWDVLSQTWKVFMWVWIAIRHSRNEKENWPSELLQSLLGMFLRTREKKWRIAERRISSNDPRSLCES